MAWCGCRHTSGVQEAAVVAPLSGHPARQKKRLVVHLGLRKVASTSLQVWFQANAETLQKQHSVLVLARHEQFETWREAVYDFMEETSHDDDSFHQGHKKKHIGPPTPSEARLLQIVEREARKIRSWMLQQPEAAILVSDENLFGARLYKQHNDNKTIPSTSTLYDWACQVLPRIEAIWEDAFDLTFVMYLRENKKDDTAWIRSCYNQEVKNNRLGLSYYDWMARLPTTLQTDKSWNDKFRSLPTQLKAPVKIILLGEEIHLGATLLQELDIDIDDGCTGVSAPSLERLNESIPEAALEFMRAVNLSNDVSYSSKPAIGAMVASMSYLFMSKRDNS